MEESLPPNEPVYWKKEKRKRENIANSRIKRYQTQP